MACGPPCDVAVGCMRPSRKTITFPSRFFSHRHCLKIESLTAPAARRESDGDNYPPKGRKPLRGAKESFLGAKTACASAGDDDGRRRIDFIDGRFRRESAEIRMRIRMHFDFGGRKRLQCLQAVELRPDSIDIRMQPYALPLKGKGRKKVQLPKEAHKVHTDA